MYYRTHNSIVSFIYSRNKGRTYRREDYASRFEGLISFIMALVPSNEVIEQALRKTVPMYPGLAVRE